MFHMPRGGSSDMEDRVVTLGVRHRELVRRLAAIQSAAATMSAFVLSVAPQLKGQLLRGLSLQNLLTLVVPPTPSAAANGGVNSTPSRRAQVIASEPIRQRLMACCAITFVPSSSHITTGAERAANVVENDITIDTSPPHACAVVAVDAQHVITNCASGLSASSFDALLGLLQSWLMPPLTWAMPPSSSTATERKHLSEFIAAVSYLAEGVLRYPELFLSCLRGHAASSASSLGYGRQAMLEGLERGASQLHFLIQNFEAAALRCSDHLSRVASPPRKKARGDNNTSRTSSVSPTSGSDTTPVLASCRVDETDSLNIGTTSAPVPGLLEGRTCVCVMTPLSVEVLRGVALRAMDIVARIRTLQQ